MSSEIITALMLLLVFFGNILGSYSVMSDIIWDISNGELLFAYTQIVLHVALIFTAWYFVLSDLPYIKI